MSRDANLSLLERYNTSSRGFWQLDIDPRIKEYIEHKQLLDKIGQVYYSILKENPSICFRDSQKLNQ